MAHPDLEYALSDAILRDVDAASGSRLRDMRTTVIEVENQMSYVRRVAQSRIDLARSELSERTAGRARSELADVIRRLPRVLSEQVAPGGPARFAEAEIDPDPVYSEDLDAVVPPMRMLDIGVLTRNELREIIVHLESIEARTSVQRRIVQERLDVIHHAVATDVGAAR